MKCEFSKSDGIKVNRRPNNRGSCIDFLSSGEEIREIMLTRKKTKKLIKKLEKCLGK